ncbi:MAG: hypothetical protein FJ030_06885 [Chloroflexi bacterium]|nr:hypothetical protein [Chloroflexota bacterium]
MVAILLLAAYLRCADLGSGPMGNDDAVISLRAIGIARYGQRPLIGPVMSVGFWHSPLTFYLYAVPYSLSLDPRLASLFTTAMNLAAVALVYFIGRRFFSRPAGLIAALLMAVHPETIMFGRGIWNSNLGAPFVMLFVATALLGYYHDHRWARVAHLPALSLGLQCHPAAVLLLPITAVAGLYAWVWRPGKRRELILETALGGAIALFTLLPWGIGIYGATQNGGPQSEVNALKNRGLAYTIQVLYEGLGYWRKHFSQGIVPGLMAAGSLWLIARSLRRRDGLPGLIAVMGFFLIPILALALDAKFRDSYLTSSYPNAFLVMGALIGGATNEQRLTGPDALWWNWRGLIHTPYFRWIAPPLVSFITGLHLIYAFTPPESYLGSRYSLKEQIAAINAAHTLAAQSGREVLLLANDTGDEPPYIWELLNQGRPSRVIWHNRPLPLPEKGAVMIGFANYDSRPLVFAGGQMYGEYFRIVELPPADQFKPNLPPLHPIRLSSGFAFLGLFTQPPGNLPVAGQPWTVYLVSRVDTPGSDDFTLFAHLIDADGNKSAQLDVPALPAAHQRAGEHVLSQLDFQLGEGFPTTGPLYLRVGMYNSAGQAKVLDDGGNEVNDYGLIQIRGQAEPLMEWDSGIALDSLTTNAPLLQGPPLDVAATWHIVRNPEQDLRLRWRLIDSGHQTAFETFTDLLPGAALTQIPAGTFVAEHYLLRAPTDISPGLYHLEVQWAGPGGESVAAPFQTAIEIQPRERRFEPPPMSHTLNVIYGDSIRLLGYDLLLDGATLRLALHWQTAAQILRDYKYFIHIWRGHDVVAQADSMPASYQYLTSWWAPGEVVSEITSLDLSHLDAGRYTLTTGFYDPSTGERLPVTLADGSRLADGWLTLQEIDLP